MIIGFVVAIALGAGHAFTPGHGKYIMADYLIGRHWNAKNAIVMGLTSTANYTSSVVLFGLIIMFLPVHSAIYFIPFYGKGIWHFDCFNLYILYRRMIEKLHHKTNKNVVNSDNNHGNVLTHKHLNHHNHHYPHSHTAQAFWLHFPEGLPFVL